LDETRKMSRWDQKGVKERPGGLRSKKESDRAETIEGEMVGIFRRWKKSLSRRKRPTSRKLMEVRKTGVAGGGKNRSKKRKIKVCQRGKGTRQGDRKY